MRLVTRLILASLIFSVAVAAEVIVVGRVVDENGTPIASVSVTFQAAGGPPDMPYAGTTGPAGNVAVRLPGEGRYTVNAACRGFYPLRDQPIEILADAQVVQLIMNHLGVVTESVDVRGQTNAVDPEQTDLRKSLSAAEIVNIPYGGRDVSNALRLLPGVVQDPQGRVHLAGSAVNQVLYTLDGFDITDPISGRLNTRLNIDTVRSLEYSNGRYSAEYGKGSAGNVAIATHMGKDQFEYGATNFVPGVDTASGLHIGTWSPRFTFSGPIQKHRAWFSESGDVTYSELVVEDVKGKNRTPTLLMDNLLRVQFNLNPRNLLFASFLVNTTNTPGSGLSALDPYSTTINRRARTWFFSIKEDRYLESGALVEWGYAEHRTLTRESPQGDGLYMISPYGRSGNFFVNSTQDASRRELLASFSPRPLRFAGTHQLKLGVDSDRLTYHVNTTRTGFELYGLNGTRLNRTTFTGSGVWDRPNLEAASYVVDHWKLREGLAIDAGIRQDWDELLRNVVFSPRLAISWAPFGRTDTRLTAGYAVTRDATSLEEFGRPLDQVSVGVTYNEAGGVARGPSLTYFRIPASGLKTPTYTNWSAGVERSLPRRILLTAGYHRKRGVNGLTYLPRPGVTDPAINGIFELKNYRRDVFDSAEITVRQNFGKDFVWTASYTRSRALSNSVVSLAVDEPLWVTNNIGRMPWDVPNHFQAWGYFPTPWKTWAISCVAEARNGFPYSRVTDYGATVGEINAYRFPAYFDLDLHVEKQLLIGKRHVALRGGFNNITNHRNPTVVNSVIGGPQFLTFYGSPGRHVVFRVRWLGKDN